MSQSLYRKYRPSRFSELIGQDHIAVALTNSLRDHRVGHAYLFSGPRGTGKTSTARILAKALNCLALEANGEPCGTCANCVDINEGRFLDLFELDAASNNSVADIRDVVEGVNLGTSTTGLKKVYLIDEVHMLSTAASNALLKTLEEPPDHVAFILATTNPEKVLPTIRSRTQHFEFALLDDGDLANHLRSVLDREGVGYEPEAVDSIARKGAGSARDALSALDQILAVSPASVDAAALEIGFGSSAFDTIVQYLAAVLAGDVTAALVAISELHHDGIDGRRIVDEALARLRDAYLLVTVGDRVHVPVSEHEAQRLRALCDTTGPGEVLRIMDLLGAAAVDIRSGTTPDPRLALEVATVRLTRPDAGADIGSLSVRVERIERAMNGTSAAGRGPGPDPARGATSRPEPAPAGVAKESVEVPSGNSNSPQASPPPSTAMEPGVAVAGGGGPRAALGALRAQRQGTSRVAPAPATVMADAVGVTLDDAIASWPAVVEGLDQSVRTHLQHAQPAAIEEADVIVFRVEAERGDAVRRAFQRAAQQVRDGYVAALGVRPRFRLAVDDPPPRTLDVAEPSPTVTTPNESEPPEAHEHLSAAAGEAMMADGDVANEQVDSISKVLDVFGGTVVEETPRPK